VKFAEIANAIGAYIEEKSKDVADVSIGGQALEETVKRLQELTAEVEAYQPKIDEAETLHQVRTITT
jgi:hypothetical protein